MQLALMTAILVLGATGAGVWAFQPSPGEPGCDAIGAEGITILCDTAFVTTPGAVRVLATDLSRPINADVSPGELPGGGDGHGRLVAKAVFWGDVFVLADGPGLWLRGPDGRVRELPEGVPTAVAPVLSGLVRAGQEFKVCHLGGPAEAPTLTLGLRGVDGDYASGARGSIHLGRTIEAC